MLRSSQIGFGLAVTALLAFQLGGCSSSPGGGGTGKGGTTGSAGSSAPGAGGSGGSSSPGAGGSGGSSSPGAGGSGGSSSPGAGGSGGSSAGGSGGSSAGGSGGSSAGGSGGSSAGGSGGSSAGGSGGSSAGGSGGSSAGGAGGSGFGQPACGTTAAGTAIAKGVTCTATDTQLCYKNCGPQNIGRKSETCGPGADGGMVYAEMTGCSFDPSMTYACYKVPTTANAACPAPADGGTGTFATPQASQACSVADSCTLCNSLGGLATGMYLDSSASAKTGYCVCVANKWSCASNTAWPCGPDATSVNPGCQ